jgi:CubicO group peptidase (beta-lactamase class C family)
MAGLQSLLESYVDNGSVPGAVGLVARGDRIEVAVVGSVAIDGDAMARDSIFRLASVTKPITCRGGHDAGRGRADRAR